MSRPRVEVPVPALALRRSAAAACGVSETFDEHIRPHLATVHVGTVALYPLAELERFLAESAVVKVRAA